MYNKLLSAGSTFQSIAETSTVSWDDGRKTLKIQLSCWSVISGAIMYVVAFYRISTSCTKNERSEFVYK